MSSSINFRRAVNKLINTEFFFIGSSANKIGNFEVEVKKFMKFMQKFGEVRIAEVLLSF